MVQLLFLLKTEKKQKGCRQEEQAAEQKASALPQLPAEGDHSVPEVCFMLVDLGERVKSTNQQARDQAGQEGNTAASGGLKGCITDIKNMRSLEHKYGKKAGNRIFFKPDAAVTVSP